MKMFESLLTKEPEACAQRVLQPMEKCASTISGNVKVESSQDAYYGKPELTALSWTVRAKRLYGCLSAQF